MIEKATASFKRIIAICVIGLFLLFLRMFFNSKTGGTIDLTVLIFRAKEIKYSLPFHLYISYDWLAISALIFLSYQFVFRAMKKSERVAKSLLIGIFRGIIISIFCGFLGIIFSIFVGLVFPIVNSLIPFKTKNTASDIEERIADTRDHIRIRFIEEFHCSFSGFFTASFIICLWKSSLAFLIFFLGALIVLALGFVIKKIFSIETGKEDWLFA